MACRERKKKKERGSELSYNVPPGLTQIRARTQTRVRINTENKEITHNRYGENIQDRVLAAQQTKNN